MTVTQLNDPVNLEVAKIVYVGDFPVDVTTEPIEVYVAPAPDDVLFGRGGGTNLHDGNKRYREEIDIFRIWYKAICVDNNKLSGNVVEFNKRQKTNLSLTLLNAVKSKGRFLKEDEIGVNLYYEVDDNAARKKISQALREKQSAPL